MSYIPEYHENYYRVEGTAYNQGKIGIGTINPVQLLHVSGGNFRVDGTGYVNGDLNVTGNLNVYGTTAQFAVSQVIAEDKSLELNVATGTAIGGGNYTTAAFSDDAGANDGGIVVKSTSLDSTRGVQDKVIVYRNSTPNSGWVSNLRFVVSGNYGKDTLNLSDTTANVGITIATDTNLYRSGANQLNTDDNFASTNNGGKTTFQLTDTTANVGMTIGGDANLYRSTNNTLKTDDNLIVDLNLTANGNATLGDATTDTHIVNGTLTNNLPDNTATAVDFKENTNSYLKLTTTDSSELVTIGLIPKFTSLNTTEATASAAAGATFAGGVGITKKLWVGGNFQVEGNTILGLSDTNTISIYGPTTFLNANSASKGLLIGTDTNLYRSAVDTLKTDDSLIVDLNLTVSGNTTLGNAYADTVLITGRLLQGIINVSGSNTSAVQTSALNVTSDKVVVTGAGIATLASIALPTWSYGSEIEVKNRSGGTLALFSTGTAQILTTTGTPPLLPINSYIQIANNANSNLIATFSGTTPLWIA